MLQRGACAGRHLGHDCVNRALKRCRAQGPAERKAGTSSACARSTSWQGPSPLPQHCAAPCPAGGQSPPASALPATGGRFAPAGSGAGLRSSRTCRSGWHCAARAGETRVAFPVPARRSESTLTASMAGAIAPATALGLPPWPAAGQSPRPKACPVPGGCRPSAHLKERSCCAMVSDRAGQTRCTSQSAVHGSPLFAPDQKGFPPAGGRDAAFAQCWTSAPATPRSPARRCATIWARIDRAISSGVIA